MKDSMLSNDKTAVQNALDELIWVCKEALFWHDSVLVLLPGDERVKHETWFKAKMLNNDDSIATAKNGFWIMMVSLFRMILIPMTAFQTWVANAQVKEAIILKGQARHLHVSRPRLIEQHFLLVKQR